MAASRPAASFRRAVLPALYSPGTLTGRALALPSDVAGRVRRGVAIRSTRRSTISTHIEQHGGSTLDIYNQNSQQLRALHAQHLPRSRRSSMLTVGAALHARAQEVQRDVRQRQHDLPGQPGAARPFIDPTARLQHGAVRGRRARILACPARAIRRPSSTACRSTTGARSTSLPAPACFRTSRPTTC